MSKRVEEAWGEYLKEQVVYDPEELLREGWRSSYDLGGHRWTVSEKLRRDPKFESQLFRVNWGGMVRRVRYFRPKT